MDSRAAAPAAAGAAVTSNVATDPSTAAEMAPAAIKSLAALPRIATPHLDPR
jgi:hypothetical protein